MGDTSQDGAAVIRTRSAAGTAEAGRLLGGLVRAGDVIALSGGLGAGKTCFVQGLAGGLEVTGHVTSPTFNLLLAHHGRLDLFHFDLYRLTGAEQLEDIDFYETAEAAGGVTAVEWADRFPAEMPSDRLDVSISIEGEDARVLRVAGTGEQSVGLARAWTRACEGAAL